MNGEVNGKTLVSCKNWKLDLCCEIQYLTGLSTHNLLRKCSQQATHKDSDYSVGKVQLVRGFYNLQREQRSGDVGTSYFLWHCYRSGTCHQGRGVTCTYNCAHLLPSHISEVSSQLKLSHLAEYEVRKCPLAKFKCSKTQI